ncbi:hypothetical protein MMPV_008854 [Pyropia vietnamensis]
MIMLHSPLASGLCSTDAAASAAARAAGGVPADAPPPEQHHRRIEATVRRQVAAGSLGRASRALLPAVVARQTPELLDRVRVLDLFPAVDGSAYTSTAAGRSLCKTLTRLEGQVRPPNPEASGGAAGGGAGGGGPSGGGNPPPSGAGGQGGSGRPRRRRRQPAHAMPTPDTTMTGIHAALTSVLERLNATAAPDPCGWQTPHIVALLRSE